MKYIFFNSRDELVRVNVANIVFFESDGNYTNLYTTNKMRSTIGITLGSMEKALASQLGAQASVFVRIGKRFIVNKNFIYKVNIPKQSLALSDCDRFLFQLKVSKEALKTLKQLIVNE